MKLIDKSALVAEIKKRLHKYEKEYEELAHYEIWITAKTIEPKIKELKNLLSFLDTIEVKEVDLKKEIDKIWKPRFSLGWDANSLISISYEGFKAIAKHFFELGLNMQKGK